MHAGSCACSRDLIIRAVDANARHQEGLRGKKPRHFFVSAQHHLFASKFSDKDAVTEMGVAVQHKPSDTDHSFEKKWWSELHWKRYAQSTLVHGPCCLHQFMAMFPCIQRALSTT